MPKTAQAHAAHARVAHAIKTGKLKRPKKCQRCGKQAKNIEASHVDYAQPLAVTWLCVPCHRKEDRANPKGGTVATATPKEPKLTDLRDRIIELRRAPAKDVVPSDFNWRTHPEAQKNAVEESLSMRGIYAPLLTYLDADGNAKLFDGHLRDTLIVERLGPDQIIPIIVTDLSEAEARSVNLTHDPLSAMAGVDKGKLEALMRECEAAGQETAKLVQFLAKQNKIDWSEIAKANPGIAQGVGLHPIVEDEPPPLPVTPVVSLGELWLLGDDHKILCGDARNREDIARVLGGEKAVCICTDPPWGVSIGAKNRMLNSVQPSGRNLTDVIDDDLTPEQLEAELLPAFVNMRECAMADDCTLFVCSPQGSGLGMMMMMMMQNAGLRARHVLIWYKNAPTFSMGRLDYDYQHEPILLTWLDRHKRPMQGEHKTSVWKIDKPRASPEHPTMKPVSLYCNAYLNNSDDGDVVFDPYLGSGTAIIAAHHCERRARGLEIDPHYCDVVIERFEAATGQRAIREDGIAYEALKAERQNLELTAPSAAG